MTGTGCLSGSRVIGRTVMGGALPLVFGIQIKRIRKDPLFVYGGGTTYEKEQ